MSTATIEPDEARSEQYLGHAGVVQEGEQRLAVSSGRGLVVDHGHLDPPRVSSHTQADQGDLDDGQQELETQRAANTRSRSSDSSQITDYIYIIPLLFAYYSSSVCI